MHFLDFIVLLPTQLLLIHRTKGHPR